MNTNTLRVALVAVLLLSTSLVGTVGAVTTDPTTSAVDVRKLGVEQLREQTSDSDLDLDEEADSSEDAEADEPESVVVEHDSSIRVTEMRFNSSSETMFLTLQNRGDRDVYVTITEVIDIEKAEGSRFGLIEPEVRAGETVTVSVSARRFGRAAAVMVTTAESKDAGYGSIVQEDGPSTSILRGEATWTDVRAGVLFTLLVACGVFVLAAWHVVATRNEGYSEVSLQ